jgi:GGDEF domain-containing protein
MTNQSIHDSHLMGIRLDAQRRALQMASLSQDDYRRILRLLQLLSDAECAWISLLSEDQDQLLEGLDIPTGIPPSITQRVIAGEGLFECGSADCDPQLRSHPWCSEHELGWLAAYPLHSPEGHAMGIVAVAAREPRSLDIRQRLALVDLVNLLEVEMRLRFLLASQPQALRKQMHSISLANQQGGAKLLDPAEISDLLHCSYTRCRLEGRAYALALVELDPLSTGQLDAQQAEELQLAAANRLLRNLRMGDLLGLWHQDRLLVLLPGVDSEELYGVGDKLVHSLDDVVDLESRSLSLTASIGLVGVQQLKERLDLDLLLHAAGEALGQAIDAGRNRARVQPLTQE